MMVMSVPLPSICPPAYDICGLSSNFLRLAPVPGGAGIQSMTYRLMTETENPFKHISSPSKRPCLPEAEPCRLAEQKYLVHQNKGEWEQGCCPIGKAGLQ